MPRDDSGTPRERRKPLTVGEMLANQRNAFAARALDLELENTLLRQTLEQAQQRIAELEAAVPAEPG